MTTTNPDGLPELPVALASIHADGYWTTDDRRPDWKWPARQRVFSVDQMHQYARDYAAMLAAAPAASGGEVWTREMIADVHKRGEELFQRINPQAAAPVSERARELLVDEYMDSKFAHLNAIGLCIRDGSLENDTAISLALRAIEQALTQQRGKP